MPLWCPSKFFIVQNVQMPLWQVSVHMSSLPELELKINSSQSSLCGLPTFCGWEAYSLEGYIEISLDEITWASYKTSHFLGWALNKTKIKWRGRATKLRFPKLLKMRDAHHLGCLKSVWHPSSADCVRVHNVMLEWQYYGSQNLYLVFNIFHTEPQSIFKLLKWETL